MQERADKHGGVDEVYRYYKGTIEKEGGSGGAGGEGGVGREEFR